MTRGDLVAKQVELWDRTPFEPAQCVRGRGVDCKMLPAGVARELGFPEGDSFYALTRDYDLSKKRGLPHSLLVEGMAALFDRVDDVRPGDLMLFSHKGKPCHVGIASRNEGRVWHAQIDPNPYVKEASIRALSKILPLHSIWRWRDG